MLKAMSANISRVAKILNDEKVDIEAELLFTAMGTNKLGPQLERLPRV